MSKNLSSDALRTVVHRLISEEASPAHVVVRYADDLLAGKISHEFVDAVEQLPTADWNLYSAYPLVVFDSLLAAGKLLQFCVDIETHPYRDHDIQRIQNTLDNLPAPFKGEFAGGTNDFDGFIWWDSNIELVDEAGERKSIASRKVPLEVGYTRGITSLYHVLLRGGLARWPYGSSEILIFIFQPNQGQDSWLTSHSASRAHND